MEKSEQPSELCQRSLCVNRPRGLLYHGDEEGRHSGQISIALGTDRVRQLSDIPKLAEFLRGVPSPFQERR
jgi:hypothetical protein